MKMTATLKKNEILLIFKIDFFAYLITELQLKSTVMIDSHGKELGYFPFLKPSQIFHDLFQVVLRF
jgi:hypothetical protein